MKNILNYHLPVLDLTLEHLNHLKSLKLLLLLNLTENIYYRQIIIDKYVKAIDNITLYYYYPNYFRYENSSERYLLENLAKESVELTLLNNDYLYNLLLRTLYKKIKDNVPLNLKNLYFDTIAQLMDTHYKAN